MPDNRPLVCVLHADLPEHVLSCPCYTSAIAEDIRTTWSRIDAPWVRRAQSATLPAKVTSAQDVCYTHYVERDAFGSCADCVRERITLILA